MNGSTMNLDLPYLFAPQAKGRRYYYYRREGRRIPITDDAGNKVKPETDLAGFLAAYNRIQETFGSATSGRREPDSGSLAHTISSYIECPEYKQLAEKTRSDYRRYLDALRAYKGEAKLSRMPPEFLTQLRNKYADRPRTANYMLAVMRLVLKHAEAQPNKFGMPSGWRMPGKWPTKLKTGEGRHRAWEEFQIDAFAGNGDRPAASGWPSNCCSTPASAVATSCR